MNKIIRSVKSISHVQLGLAGEQFIATLLDTTRLHLSGHDVKYRTLRLEVKTARRNARGNWQVMLKKDDKYGQTDCSKSDFLVIICLDDEGTINKMLVIKASLMDKQTLTIGEASQYNRYQVKPLNLKRHLDKFV